MYALWCAIHFSLNRNIYNLVCAYLKEIKKDGRRN